MLISKQKTKTKNCISWLSKNTNLWRVRQVSGFGETVWLHNTWTYSSGRVKLQVQSQIRRVRILTAPWYEPARCVSPCLFTAPLRRALFHLLLWFHLLVAILFIGLSFNCRCLFSCRPRSFCLTQQKNAADAAISSQIEIHLHLEPAFTHKHTHTGRVWDMPSEFCSLW